MRDLRTLLQLLRLLAPFKGAMALSALLGFATVGSGIGLMATAAFLLAGAALHPSVADLAVPIVGVRFFGLARGVFRYLERYLSHRVNLRLLARLRVWFYAALEPLAPARLMRHRSGDLLGRVVADVESLQNLYLRALAPPAVALLVGLLMALFLSSFDPSLAGALATFLLLAGVGVPLLAWWLARGVGREMARVRSELNVQMVEGIQGLADLLAFGQEDRHRARVEALNREWTGLQRRMALISAVEGALMGLLANLGMLAVLVVAIPLVSQGRLEGIVVPVLALAALACFEAVTPLPAAFQHLEASLASGRRLLEIVEEGGMGRRGDGETGREDAETRGRGDAERVRQHSALSTQYPEPRTQNSPVPPSPCPPIPPSSRLPVSLCVEDLRFRYGPGEPLALDGVSLEVAAGQRVAVVGPSGAGKSTLAHLLLRFWDYQEGRILLGGRELRDYPPEQVRALAGVVSQRTHLFNTTLRENLLIARPEATEGEMIEASIQARLHPFAESLPRGYDSLVGEQGVRLSGGERQRVAIARALLRNAPILILDEATANLDAVAEREVLRTLHGLARERTTLVITHRLVGLESMDLILVLRAGRVVERGRHAELLQSAGLYRAMWDLQQELLP